MLSAFATDRARLSKAVNWRRSDDGASRTCRFSSNATIYEREHNTKIEHDMALDEICVLVSESRTEVRTISFSPAEYRR
jgi:hypothetical protein